MKSIILIIYLSIHCLICYAQINQPIKDTLYLYFKDNQKMMTFDSEIKDGFPMYHYNLCFDEKGEETIHFWSFLDEEQTKYNKDFSYKPKLYREVVSIDKLRKIELKNHKWLKEKLATYKWNERIYMKYNPIYIVEIDSIAKRAYITRVKGNEREY